MGRKRQPIALKAQSTGNSYDAEGFVTSEQVHITEQQLEWLAYRMSSASDEEASSITDIDPEVVVGWLEVAGFKEVYSQCLANKREGFKFLSTQLLPKALRTISALMDSDKLAAQVQGVTLLLRTNGLLIDKKQVANPDDIRRLVDALRAPMLAPPSIIDVTPKRIRGA